MINQNIYKEIRRIHLIFKTQFKNITRMEIIKTLQREFLYM